MKHLNHKKIIRAASTAFAGALVFSSMAMFAGCTTAHPEVRITVEFNSQSYELDYTLYRTMYPSTVQHFIELAENGYYDGLCVHNYESNFYYTGAYSYNEADTGNGYGGLEYKDYYTTVKGYDSFTQSVFDLETGEGTYTLYGEFGDNAYAVENNALKHEYGSLVMFYEDISSCEARVNVQYNSSDKKGVRDYKLNSATSEFYLFGGSSSSTRNSKYCVFGQLQKEEPFDELREAISAFISDQGEGYEFTTSYRVQINTDDAYADKDRVSYSVPQEPIIIKSVKVLKY